MKALVLQEDKSLILTTQEKPVPGPSEVVVAVKASALNHTVKYGSKRVYIQV